MYEDVVVQSIEHINQKDIILTFGKSDLLTAFLKYAHNGGDIENEEETES